jgi:hypothetical protein
MKSERVARTLLGAAALCLLFVSVGCNTALPSGTPIVSGMPHGDWGVSLLAGGTVGAGMSPAKFVFDINATPSCANDYVAFNTGLTGVSPTTAASQTATFPSLSILTPSGTITITNGAVALVLTAAGDNTGNDFQVVSNLLGGSSTNAASLAARIAALGGPVGVTAASATNVVTITALNKGIGGNSITLATTIAAAQFTLGGAALAGGVGTGNIVAFNQLYSTQGGVGGFCNQNGPSVYWSYFTGAGQALTSVVLSFDGTKIAFVENAAGGATLRILKWKAGEGAGAGYPLAPTTTLSAGQSWAANCPAANSCISGIAFNGASQDTGSAPFYNYALDILYVGDDKGVLHKFTGVFLGTPAEVTAGGWPITVHAGAILTGPVFDSTSNNIFVADHSGQLSFVKEVGSVTGACAAGSPPCLGSVSQALTGSIVDPPIVDGTTGRVLVFDGTEGTNEGSVFQFDTALTVASKITVGIGGNKTTPPANLPFDVLHSGTFDDAYFSVGPASGHLYTCGKDPGFNNRPAIYQLTFNASGVLSAAAGTPLVNLTTTFSLIGDACSPVTELKNGATDQIFFSFATNANPPPAPGTATGCTGLVGGGGPGCVVSIALGGAWPPAATTHGVAVPSNVNVAAQSGSGGTSAIVVDNVGAGAQESNLYYTYQTNSTAAVPCNGTTGVGCAVKVTQAGLN